jgi:ribosome recycling factor
MKDILGQTTKKMEGAIAHLQEELRSLRTGRANVGMVDKVSVEVYGTAMRLTDIATVSVPEARMLLIVPFDAANAHAIAKGVNAANLNLQAVVDGKHVRVRIPEMDNSVRQKMAKEAKRMGEDAKIAVRSVRKEANDSIKKESKEGSIPEDLMNSWEKEVQKLTDTSCKKIDDLCASKEKEILTI